MKTLIQENFSSLEYWTIWQMQGEARVLIKVLSTENVSFLIDEIFTTLFWSFLSKQFRTKHWLSGKLLGINFFFTLIGKSHSRNHFLLIHTRAQRWSPYSCYMLTVRGQLLEKVIPTRGIDQNNSSEAALYRACSIRQVLGCSFLA